MGVAPGMNIEAKIKRFRDDLPQRDLPELAFSVKWGSRSNRRKMYAKLEVLVN
jgi:hypothetical protein